MRGLKLHLVTEFLRRLDGDRFIPRLESAVLILVGAYLEADVKGAVTPVNDTFSVKYALFFFHARCVGSAQVSSQKQHIVQVCIGQVKLVSN
jgi:hypothetical protein